MNIPPPLTNPSKRLDHILYDLVISTWTAMKDNKKAGHNTEERINYILHVDTTA